jgi:hypothetical protein
VLYSAFDKDPQAKVDYVLDWTTELGTDNIATSTFPDFPAGLTLTTSSNTTKTVTLWVEGGTQGQDYQFTNRITTSGARTLDWMVVIHVLQPRVFNVAGPPFATVQEAQADHPASEGAEALTVERILRQASGMVARLAPRPAAISGALSAGMDASQTTVPVPKIEDFPDAGTLKIDSEVIHYFGKSPTTVGAVTGTGTLTNAVRGREATLPATHSSGALATEVSYPLLARDAELAVFEWLWDTRGYKPSRTGVIGSESYSIDPEQIKAVVRQTMGRFYTGGGKVKSVGVKSSFPRSYRNRRYPYWVGNG